MWIMFYAYQSGGQDLDLRGIILNQCLDPRWGSYQWGCSTVTGEISLIGGSKCSQKLLNWQANTVYPIWFGHSTSYSLNFYTIITFCLESKRKISLKKSPEHPNLLKSNNHVSDVIQISGNYHWMVIRFLLLFFATNKKLYILKV